MRFLSLLVVVISLFLIAGCGSNESHGHYAKACNTCDQVHVQHSFAEVTSTASTTQSAGLSLTYVGPTNDYPDDYGQTQVFEVVSSDNSPVTIARAFPSCECMQVVSTDNGRVVLRQVEPAPRGGVFISVIVSSPSSAQLRMQIPAKL